MDDDSESENGVGSVRTSLIYADTINTKNPFQIYGEKNDGGKDHGMSMHRYQLSQYVAGVYWAFTTMTTVGYGDILPQNDIERAFAIFIMFTGALCVCARA